ncbi:metalloregulator ArsR/SmtB family transcription factor [Aliikangiella sp. G2MR2-5]|uniref:helix-turn-helix transcriptional regulator n=1 Tax=Aliikangiella sp. G2MR2-5 TaxID=2788943 RepID=UPI0018AA8B4E|nr:metalloregulator ArsR/SmtB family transcription factor [Aliikangiella sp. G2MR2-5]
MSDSFQSSQTQILHLLKTRGALSAVELSDLLPMTSMGARQHLEHMEEQGLVIHEFVSEGKGRPKKRWSLTPKADSHFPDGHSALLVNLLGQMQKQLGGEAFEELIKSREQEMLTAYKKRMSEDKSVEEKLNRLVQIRNDEGYMAQVIRTGEGLFFIENHCPICAAASQCQQFCRSELAIFQALLGTQIERTEYILEGARRCAYRIVGNE